MDVCFVQDCNLIAKKDVPVFELHYDSETQWEVMLPLKVRRSVCDFHATGSLISAGAYKLLNLRNHY